MKAVVAQYNAEQLLTEREKVSERIRELLEERADKYHIKLDDVSITHLAFGSDFNQAIEQKQVALQRAERAKFVVARAEQEKIVGDVQNRYGGGAAGGNSPRPSYRPRGAGGIFCRLSSCSHRAGEFGF